MAWSLLTLFTTITIASASQWTAPIDHCAAIAGQKWVSPAQARSCLSMAALEPKIKSNTIEVLNKTLAFHTSVNYQIQAPAPFEDDVHEDLHADLARISLQEYSSEFEFHLDIFRTFKRANDGHCAALNYCYDAFFVTYLPVPLVLLTGEDGSQAVHIAPEAYQVAKAEFGDNLEFWENALPGNLKGQLRSLSGARVLLINGQSPLVAVNANALTTGSYQSFATRQNSFFSSYHRGRDGWEYVMGNFAQHVHPLVDEVHLAIQRVNSSGEIDIFSLPYRSRFGSASNNFTDFVSYRANNCVAAKRTNGFDVYDAVAVMEAEVAGSPAAYFQQQPPIDPVDAKKHALNVILDGTPPSNIALPEELQPSATPLNDSYSVAQFYLLNDNSTGVLALGSFSAQSFATFQTSLLAGLNDLKNQGAMRLLVDVTNNGGGYICIAHWLHRIIIGRSETTEPQAGLDSTMRAGPLAQLIVKQIVNGSDPDELLSYNPQQWTNASHVPFPKGHDLLHPLVKKTINGHDDMFSPRLGQECQPFSEDPPMKGLFKPKDVLIVSNGRCASSCSLFSITMSKLDGVKTVVSTDFSTIDTEIKSTHLKNHTLAPPDFLTNSVQGTTWRLGFGLTDPTTPEEWQDHTADISFPLTVENVNKPTAIWEAIVKDVFDGEELFQEPKFIVQDDALL
ncbi:hypothetical protein BDZ89DRAFT_1154116 [Hymenopellis radicata]|nr:hypothetical protein BDZ89DRAFT_1154116 [Hymenopellis radicata]